MQKQELLTYQKQLNKVQSLISECVVDANNSFADKLETGKVLQSDEERRQINRNNCFNEIKKLYELIPGIDAEIKLITFEDGKEIADKYIAFVSDTIQKQIERNSLNLKGSKKYAWLDERPASIFQIYKGVSSVQNPTLEDLFAYYQVTLCESISIIESNTLKSDPISKQASVKSNDGMELDEIDLKILRLKQKGITDPKVAPQVFLSVQAVKDRLTKLRDKYNCTNTTSLISYLVKKNIL